MTTPHWINALARTLLVVVTPVILLLSPLYFFITPSFVRQQYRQAGFPAAVRFDDAERLRLSDAILHYLRGKLSRAELEALRTDGGEVALLDSEVQHLADVKRVMDMLFRLHTVSLVLACLCLYLLWHSAQRQMLPHTLRQGMWLTGGLIIFVIIASFIDFDVFFTRFHQLFFSEGSWLFYEDDTLIQLYPLPFWMAAVWKIGLAVLAELGLVYALAWLLERRLGANQP